MKCSRQPVVVKEPEGPTLGLHGLCSPRHGEGRRKWRQELVEVAAEGGERGDERGRGQCARPGPQGSRADLLGWLCAMDCRLIVAN